MTDHVEGFPVLAPDSPLLHRWVQPGADRTIRRRNGSVGLVLAHNAQRFHEKVERLDQPRERWGAIDDGAYNHRRITGGTGWSKHATGCADDLNWALHPYNTRPEKTFTAHQVRQIRKTLELYRDPVTGLHVVEWGGNWPSRPDSKAKPDPMHFQISSQVRMEHVERVARQLAETKRGQAILRANPGQRKVVFS